MDPLMDGGLLHLGSKSVLKPQLNLFTVPPTELSMSSYCIVSIQLYSPRGHIKIMSSNSPIQTYMTSINHVEFKWILKKITWILVEVSLRLS